MSGFMGREDSRKRIKMIALNGLMIAMVLLVTMATKIPGPVGYFNIGDAAIIIAAVILGRKSGFIAGAFGSALADIFNGYLVFAPITFLVKGLEGLLIGYIIYKFGSKGVLKDELTRIFAIITGCLFMIGGYFVAEAYILKIIDPTYGLAQATTDFYFNIVQGAVSAGVGYIISTSLVRVKALKHILE